MVGSLGADAHLKAHGLHLVPREPKYSKEVEGGRMGSQCLTIIRLFFSYPTLEITPLSN